MPSVEIAKTSASISCNDPIALPCCSIINANHNIVEQNDAKLIVENNELKEQVIKLSKSLERCFKGKATLDKLLSEQRCSFNKEGLGYVPKKGKKPANKPTRFVRQNGKYCHNCREIGHVQQNCPKGKTPSLGVYDSCYMLRKTKDGKVVARFVGTSILGAKKNAIWVPKSLVTNLQGPKQIWVPKRT